MVQTGKIRPIAITSGKRFPGLPDLPTLNEKIPGVIVDGFFAIVAPAGTPPNVIARLNHEIGAYLNGSYIQQKLLSFGLATEGAGAPESTGEFIRREQERWRTLAKELDVQPQ
ncbi:MAG: tripartite tricarboxylate transporter substrate-binding protein, partial [Xanthobacteraceae bacterium]